MRDESVKRTNRVKTFLRNSHAGVTLVELIVSMAVLSIFLTGSMMIISRGYLVYYRVRSMNEMIQVSDLVLDKVQGELEGAIQVDGVQITDGGKKIIFSNAGGSRMEVYGKDDILIVHYKEVMGDSEVKFNAADWKFDENSYMGCALKELTFSKAGTGYPDNVIKVNIKVSTGNVDYSAERYIRLFNYALTGETGITS